MTNFIIYQCSVFLLPALSNLLLANIIILLCFLFLFLVIFNNFVIISVDIKNARLNLALAISTGAPITVANDAIETLPLADKTIKKLLK